MLLLQPVNNVYAGFVVIHKIENYITFSVERFLLGGRPTAVMNPEYNIMIKEGDRMVMISEEFKTTEPLRPGVDDGASEKIEMIEAGAEKTESPECSL